MTSGADDPTAAPSPGARRQVPTQGVAWAVLLTAALLEVVWSLALKNADGLTRPGLAVGGLALAMVSLGLLSYALKTLAVGTGYAVWVGIGAVGVATSGTLFLGEPADGWRVLCLALILAGVIGLSLTERPPPPVNPEPLTPA